MKKLIHSLTALTLLIFMVSFNGCDELQSLPLNVPIPFEFETSGNSSSTDESRTICVSSVEDLAEYRDDIKQIRFLNAAYWTESATPGLSGNLTLSLRTQNGTPILSINLPNVRPADYLNTPFVINLSPNEIQLLETYLSNFVNSNECFVALLSITNTNPTNHTIKGRVEIVVEAEVEF
ncbi:MAG: hypothetical protein HND52_18465 [Ignavibacteriae bacterium]|nr:hypothetical protein [Ignavibacteriota bacterium]NOG99947.1 hypothetical protein [Ignavibacteriota bacterium]